MLDNKWRRYIIMNTTTAPAYLQGKIEKRLERPTPLDLNEVLKDCEQTCPTFEELMKEVKE